MSTTPTTRPTEQWRPGQRVTVVRTSGTVETDWHLMTDITIGDTGFRAPECIGVKVWKFTKGTTFEDFEAGRPVSYLVKRCSLLDLINWAS